MSTISSGTGQAFGRDGDASQSALAMDVLLELRHELADLHGEFTKISSAIAHLSRGPEHRAARQELERRQDDVRSRIRRVREEIDACWDE